MVVAVVVVQCNHPNTTLRDLVMAEQVVADMVAEHLQIPLLTKILHHFYRNGLNQVQDINMQDLDINIWAAAVVALKDIPIVL